MNDGLYSGGRFLTILVHISRWVVGIIFLAAALPKILDAESFMRVVANYNIVPLFLVPVSAIMIPWIELTCGICLLMNRCVRSVLAILTVLVIAFIGGLAVNYFRGSEFDCGCFGILFQGGQVGIMTIIRDALLLGLTAFILFLSNPKASCVQK